MRPAGVLLVGEHVGGQVDLGGLGLGSSRSLIRGRVRRCGGQSLDTGWGTGQLKGHWWRVLLLMEDTWHLALNWDCVHWPPRVRAGPGSENLPHLGPQDRKKG